MDPRITRAAELLDELNQAKAEALAAQKRVEDCEARFLAFLDGRLDPTEREPEPKPKRKGGFTQGPRSSVEGKAPTASAETAETADGEKVPSVPNQLRAYFAAHPEAEMNAEELVAGPIKAQLDTVRSKLNVLCRKGYLERTTPGRFRLARSDAGQEAAE